MEIILVGIGAIGFIGYLIWLIVRIRNWDSKIPPIIGMLLCLIMFLGGASTIPTSDKNSGDGDSKSTPALDVVKPIEDNQNPKEDPLKESEKEGSSFSVGEPVNLNDVIVTLVNVHESKGSSFFEPEEGKTFVLCEFEIENNSKKDINVSSTISFEAYIDNYSAAMDLSATVSSEKSQLDGTIATGKKMNGEIGYQAPENWSNIEIRFTPDFWSRKDIVFVYEK